jgi:hypothetical protein
MSEKTTNPNQAHEAGHKHEAAKPVASQSTELTSLTDLAALQQALAVPRFARPTDILMLQRAVGNRATTRLIQAKLSVGPAHDRYEQEADRVAEQVLSMSAPAQAPATVQRAEEEDELQMKPLTRPLAATITPLVQRAVEDEEELQTKPIIQRTPEEEDLQAKPDVQRASSEAGFEAGGEFEQQLAASRGSGSPLPAEVRHGTALWRRFQRSAVTHRRGRCSAQP